MLFPLSLVCLILISVAFIYLFIPSKFPTDTPKDGELVASYWKNHAAFETLGAMALEDSEHVSRISLDTLPDNSLKNGHSAQYKELLEQIKSVAEIGIDGHNRVLFPYRGGGEFLAINRTWIKGIAYYPDGLSRSEIVVPDLDHLVDRDGIYVVPIEKNWYLIFQALD
jgi:hypothetical protein